MASEKNHDQSIYVATPVVLVIGTHYFGWELGVIAASAHLLGGLLLSPDLDLISQSYKRWGPLRGIWVPYQKFIPKHRHWLSHGILIGSVLRLLYLSIWGTLLWLIVPALSQVHWVGVTIHNFAAFFIGIELSAINHLLLDGLLLPLPEEVTRRLKKGS